MCPNPASQKGCVYSIQKQAGHEGIHSNLMNRALAVLSWPAAQVPTRSPSISLFGSGNYYCLSPVCESRHKHPDALITGTAKLRVTALTVQPNARGAWVFALATMRPRQSLRDVSSVIHQNVCFVEAKQEKLRKQSLISVTKCSWV